ncbi:MAG: hypothetical protein IPO92_20485 [Saprospiraceae bacterium]|nr:hypothetical protein [Saprospiraceae bacterium]
MSYKTDLKSPDRKLIDGENIPLYFIFLKKMNYGAEHSGNGIITLNLSTFKKHRITEKDGLANNNILYLALRKNSIWASTLAGINEINSEGKVLKTLNRKNRT